MNFKSIISFSAIFSVALFGLQPVSFADDAQILGMIRNLEEQMQEMQKTINWQRDKIGQFEKQEPQLHIASPKEEMADDYFKKNLEKHIGDSAKWLNGLKFSGDFRLRYEGINEQTESAGTDRNRFRFRLRFGFEKKFSDEFKVGFRLASGNLGGITSTNSTFDSNFGFKEVTIDKAYATYTPEWVKVGPVEKFEITGGKFKNPFLNGATKMIWDSDVTPEGIYEKVDLNLVKTEDLSVDFTALAAQLVLEEGSGGNNEDAELFGYQAGFESKITGISKKPITVKNLVSFYDYNEFTSPGNFAATNGNFSNASGLSAEAFDIIEIYNELGFQVAELPKMKVYFDYAKNLTENASAALGGGQDKAWNLGAKIGKAKKKGSWELGYEYIWVEANSVPGVFNDSDFGHADRRGSVVKTGYALTDSLKLNAAGFFTNRILTGNPARADEERRLFQVDLVWKF